ncbi:hypothetical protein [Burkholderia ubonensis]|uniref:hypothetical protein n=1 Tax=Burkholderia ubonensis TaxID=101571 RepID=UPI000AABCB8C|nr:hypothetical protein [Burkholderia ubonensis]
MLLDQPHSHRPADSPHHIAKLSKYHINRDATPLSPVARIAHSVIKCYARAYKLNLKFMKSNSIKLLRHPLTIHHATMLSLCMEARRALRDSPAKRVANVPENLFSLAICETADGEAGPGGQGAGGYRS